VRGPAIGSLTAVSQPSLDLGYEDLPDPTFSVTELAEAIDQVLRRGFRDGAWVRGEIEGMQQRPNGHMYFSLAERGAEGNATLPVVLFAGTLARMRGMLAKHRMRLGNGVAVRVHVRIEFYAPSGRVSLVMDGLDPTYTLGQLAADRDQLLRRLVGEGLLDLNKKRRLPLAPLRVGVVTSVGSAAWHDLVHELEASTIGFRLLAAHTTVQGEGAAEGIVAALRTLARHEPDVILLVRGGGSRTDLATFDDEGIARAIAAADVPVWTGLGHEIDRAIADEVAHSAHKTPTACAGALVARVQDAHRRAEAGWSAVAIRATALVDGAERRLDAVTSRTGRRTDEAVARSLARLDSHRAQLARAASRSTAEADRALAAAGRRLGAVSLAAVREADRSLTLVGQRVGVLDPAAALARGWSITHLADGTLVRSTTTVAAGAELRTTVADGTVTSVARLP
jgi:exodeoxyribonuclease VII large subunit